MNTKVLAVGAYARTGIAGAAVQDGHAAAPVVLEGNTRKHIAKKRYGYGAGPTNPLAGGEGGKNSQKVHFPTVHNSTHPSSRPDAVKVPRRMGLATMYSAGSVEVPGNPFVSNALIASTAVYTSGPSGRVPLRPNASTANTTTASLAAPFQPLSRPTPQPPPPPPPQHQPQLQPTSTTVSIAPSLVQPSIPANAAQPIANASQLTQPSLQRDDVKQKDVDHSNGNDGSESELTDAKWQQAEYSPSFFKQHKHRFGEKVNSIGKSVKSALWRAAGTVQSKRTEQQRSAQTAARLAARTQNNAGTVAGTRRLNGSSRAGEARAAHTATVLPTLPLCVQTYAERIAHEERSEDEAAVAALPDTLLQTATSAGSVSATGNPSNAAERGALRKQPTAPTSTVPQHSSSANATAQRESKQNTAPSASTTVHGKDANSDDEIDL